MRRVTSLVSGRDDDGNQVAVGQSVRFSASELVLRGDKANLVIGDGADLRTLKIELNRGSVLKIGGGCILAGRISVGSYSTVTIGANTTVTSNVMIRAVEATSITIGEDCMFASGNIIRSNDGHPIYCKKTGKRINPSQPIVIGDHVWLADEVAVLKGVTIGTGSIVGMRSLVTKDISEYCLAVGTPARVIREGVEWGRSPRAVALTMQDNALMRMA